jgi:hypothetical protein
MASTNDGKSCDLYTALLGMVLIGTITSVGIVGLQRLADALAPQVGDIVSFYRTERGGTDTPTRIKALHTGGMRAVGCILDVHVMRASGGSLVIEGLQFTPGRSYRVHWAGARTSDGGTDCGAAADLVLSRVDVVALKSAAGGPGIPANGRELSPAITALN